MRENFLLPQESCWNSASHGNWLIPISLPGLGRIINISKIFLFWSSSDEIQGERGISSWSQRCPLSTPGCSGCDTEHRVLSFSLQNRDGPSWFVFFFCIHQQDFLYYNKALLALAESWVLNISGGRDLMQEIECWRYSFLLFPITVFSLLF